MNTRTIVLHPQTKSKLGRLAKRRWEAHANVTVNHQCRDIDELCVEATAYLMKHNRAAAARRVPEPRRAI